MVRVRGLDEEIREKRAATLWSLFAALFLVSAKFAVAITTGSLAILSEAFHSLLDSFATILTFLAVRVSAKPADKMHHYGHGKAESLSAFVESALLSAVTIWMIWEALRRIFGAKNYMIEPNIWAFSVIGLSIAIDSYRSRVLYRVARKYKSQAIEADALNFASDLVTSCIALLSLTLIKISDLAGLGEGWHKVDPIAAIIVASIILVNALRLGKRAIDSLMDRAPLYLIEAIIGAVRSIEGVLGIERIRARESGGRTFVDIWIEVDRNLPFEKAHEIEDRVVETICSIIPNADVVIRAEPFVKTSEHLSDRIYALSAREGIRIHHLYLIRSGDRYSVTIDAEIGKDINLAEAHELITDFEGKLVADIPEISEINTRLEARMETVMEGEEITSGYDDIREEIGKIMEEKRLKCHEISARVGEAGIFLSLHCTANGEIPLSEADKIAESIEREIRSRIRGVAHVVVHMEPEGSQ